MTGTWASRYLKVKSINRPKPSGNFVPTSLIVCNGVFCIYGFYMILTININNDYFLIFVMVQ
jgi:hypothetical protein